jgi:UDP-glucose 4-epimerase
MAMRKSHDCISKKSKLTQTPKPMKKMGSEKSLLVDIKGTKFLVTGASGFLGSHMVDRLLQLGAKVIAFDLKRSRFLNPNAEVILGRLEDPIQLEQITKDVDIVYHFAAIADIEESAKRLNDVVQTNILGSTLLIQACIKNKVKIFNFASTMYVYSNEGSFYRVSKQCVENIIEELGRNSHLDYRILRFGSIYGPRAQEWNGLKSYVIDAWLKDKVELKSNGTAKREYIHVDDAISLSIEALNSSYANKSLVITGNQSVTSHELIDMLSEILGKKISVAHVQNRLEDHYVLTPYNYTPKPGVKITRNQYVDFGQGLLEVLTEVHKEN